MSETSTFTRSSEREPSMKPFAYFPAQIAGSSNAEKMKKYTTYRSAANLYETCMLYAASYSITMVQRVLDEEPDFFEDKDVTKDEFVAHLQNNICLAESKYRGAVIKDTSARIQEEGYLNDKIRRLANGGDKFHPYL